MTDLTYQQFFSLKNSWYLSHSLPIHSTLYRQTPGNFHLTKHNFDSNQENIILIKPSLLHTRNLTLARPGSDAPPPPMFFSDSIKTAARSTANFGIAYGKAFNTFSENVLVRVISGQVTMSQKEAQCQVQISIIVMQPSTHSF